MRISSGKVISRKIPEQQTWCHPHGTPTPETPHQDCQEKRLPATLENHPRDALQERPPNRQAKGRSHLGLQLPAPQPQLKAALAPSRAARIAVKARKLSLRSRRPKSQRHADVKSKVHAKFEPAKIQPL
nr:MAG TPA: hypothetical protein [Caudoviricetes sp.]